MLEGGVVVVVMMVVTVCRERASASRLLRAACVAVGDNYYGVSRFGGGATYIGFSLVGDIYRVFLAALSKFSSSSPGDFEIRLCSVHCQISPTFLSRCVFVLFFPGWSEAASFKVLMWPW